MAKQELSKAIDEQADQVVEAPSSEPQLPKVPAPQTASVLVRSCEATGVRIVYAIHWFYRAAGDAFERCSAGADGNPDGNWFRLEEDELPAKAKSMLGLT